MGCGSSGNVVPSQEDLANGHANGSDSTKVMNNNNNHDDDDLPTVMLPETPMRPKPPVAFEIPLDEFDSNRRSSATPPPHVQRLLQPPQTEISLPDIEEKLAVAEQRRQSILQQRAASAQKRTQKMMKVMSDMERLESDLDSLEPSKHGPNTVTIPPEPAVYENKNIS